MIEIEFLKENKRTVYFKITGHAGYREYGEDIVCAAVSSVAQMTLNGLLEIVQLKNVKYEEMEGYLVCDLRELQLTDEEKQKSFILTESMYSYLKDIAENYKEYVKIKSKEVEI